MFTTKSRYAKSENSDSEQSNHSESDCNDLTIVAEFDELMRLVKQKRNDEIEDSLIIYVQSTQNIVERLVKIETECSRLRQELDMKIQGFSDLESKLSGARMMLDKERQKTKKALYDKDALEQQLKQIKDMLCKDNRKCLADDTRQKLIYLSNLNHEHFEAGERGFPDLSAIPEGNTTGSLLSEFSYSRSGGDDDPKDTSGWDYRASMGHNDEPAAKKRRSSSHKVVEINTVDKVKATTTLTVPRKGPITATSIIEAIPPPITQMNQLYQTPEKQFARDRENGNYIKPHCLLSKITVMPENCTVCEKRVRFGKMALRCKECRAICHSECKDALPLPCIPASNTPNQKGTVGVIGDYAPTTSPMVPALIVHCIKEIEAKGLKEMGIYRIPGSEREVKLLKERFLRGRGSPSLAQMDVHVICGTVKDFLKSLLEPLVTYGKWNEFVKAVQASEPVNVISQLKDCIASLPQPNRDTLAYVLLHLKKVASAPECKMPASNLAKVFGPTIVGYSSSDPTPQTLIDETRSQIRVMEELLKLTEDYWYGIINPTTSTDSKCPLQQTPSTESLLKPVSKGVFTPSIKRIERRREKFFPPPTTQ
ncbi:rac GTPase-activating protein 1 isoform X2 [Agrilus planipennis]|uniref:Rac GTPase-activating protein 1 isoform X2 n=1 Tax=Agrilus planipennis TaxID=224129 RepID=A0A1W4WT12_AGRPL|nr:rac GTPase-activating protein 1 isoform X2 [Agrilus planipennis]